jgi:hypothetical protein
MWLHYKRPFLTFICVGFLMIKTIICLHRLLTILFKNYLTAYLSPHFSRIHQNEKHFYSSKWRISWEWNQILERNSIIIRVPTSSNYYYKLNCSKTCGEFFRPAHCHWSWWETGATHPPSLRGPRLCVHAL